MKKNTFLMYVLAASIAFLAGCVIGYLIVYGFLVNV